MARLLIVHHTTSPSLHSLYEAVLSGATDDVIEGVEVVAHAALSATAAQVMEADAFILGTSANLGYMSGALKHFFDTIYYPCLVETVQRPYGLYIHGNNDTEGAVRSIEKVVTGLQWVRVHQPVTVIGTPTKEDLEACWDLGATVAARLATGFT